MSANRQGGLQIDTIKAGIYKWARSVLALEIADDHIIWREQSQELPSRPCVTFKIVDGPRRTGYQDNTVYNGDISPGVFGKFNVGGQRVMTISCQVFGTSQIPAGQNPGPNAMQVATDLNASLSRQTVLDGLSGSGIAIWNQGEVSNITAIEETEYEERAQFDMTIGVAENITDDPGTIGTANITPNVAT